ncbi:MAG: ferritin-like domain-containing protein [Cytophagales bacterium]|nr:ferritin-like domain-containing protein [Cytophagales bacterium]
MNIFNLIESLDSKQTIKEDLASLANRRDIFRKLGDFGKKLALGTLSVGAVAAASTQKAMAADSGTDILNFALLLEYLEAEFYAKGLDAGIIPSGTPEQVFMQIGKHEAQHVEFLKKALGGAAIDKPEFDFTAKGMFKPFSNYGQFLVLAQAFEDTGVRAYKGQAGNLTGGGDLLTAALQIHSVEARHAARVRRLRGVQSWYLRTERDRNVAAVYAGEDNVTQGGVDLTTITDINVVDIQESFDEPLTKEEVTAIAQLFLA